MHLRAGDIHTLQSRYSRSGHAVGAILRCGALSVGHVIPSRRHTAANACTTQHVRLRWVMRRTCTLHCALACSERVRRTYPHPQIHTHMLATSTLRGAHPPARPVRAPRPAAVAARCVARPQEPPHTDHHRDERGGGRRELLQSAVAVTAAVAGVTMFPAASLATPRRTKISKVARPLIRVEATRDVCVGQCAIGASHTAPGVSPGCRQAHTPSASSAWESKPNGG